MAWRYAGITRATVTTNRGLTRTLISVTQWRRRSGYGWIFPLGDGRVNVGVGLLSTGGAWKGVNTTKLQEYFVSQTADAWGLSDESCCGPATAAVFPWASPSVHEVVPTR